MQKYLIMKKKWLRNIPFSFVLKKKRNSGVFFQRTHMRHTILNWNLLWFYTNYQFNLFKQLLIKTRNILLVSDFNILTKFIFVFSRNLNAAYVAGIWQGGTLTKIQTRENVPECIFNFGMKYSINFYNEVAILAIPTINLVDSCLPNLALGVSYNLFISKLNKEYIYYTVSFLIWFIQKFQKNILYDNFQIINGIDKEYINQLQIINYRLAIYKKWTKSYLFSKKNWNKNLNINLKKFSAFFNNFENLNPIKKIFFPFMFNNFFFIHQKFIIQQQKENIDFCFYKKKSSVLPKLYSNFSIL